jgi:magnesium chelatase family protein
MVSPATVVRKGKVARGGVGCRRKASPCCAGWNPGRIGRIRYRVCDHNLFFVGPPGSGKTLLAERMPGILPPLTRDEARETAVIYSSLGLLDPRRDRLLVRPFRAPHHTVSYAGLVGGGNPPRPGEAQDGYRPRVDAARLLSDERTTRKSALISHCARPLPPGPCLLPRGA